MAKTNLINNPAHWRKRAAEARRVAQELSNDPEASRTMLEIAASYEQLARAIEGRKPTDGKNE